MALHDLIQSKGCQGVSLPENKVMGESITLTLEDASRRRPILIDEESAGAREGKNND